MPKRTHPLFYRWCDTMRQRVPQMPEAVLAACYAGLEAGSSVSVDAIAEALHGDTDAAAHWHSVAAVWLIDPGGFCTNPRISALSRAEDALSRHQITHTGLNFLSLGV